MHSTGVISIKALTARATLTPGSRCRVTPVLLFTFLPQMEAQILPILRGAYGVILSTSRARELAKTARRRPESVVRIGGVASAAARRAEPTKLAGAARCARGARLGMSRQATTSTRIANVPEQPLNKE